MHGLYHVVWAVDALKRRRAQLDAVLITAAKNLDTLYTAYLWLPPAERGQRPALDDLDWTLHVLNEAQRRGVKVIFEDTPPEVRHRLAAHPALLAFGLADDANTKDPDKLRALCHPTQAPGARRYISIGATPQQPNAHCYGLSELIGVQVYPFQFASSDPATQPAESIIHYWPILTAARATADLHGQRLIANLQIHRNYSQRHPTPEQVRVLAWAAMAAGVDGILWYALLDNDPSGPMWAPTELTSAVRDVTAEIRAGTSGRPTHCTLDGHILTAEWPGGTRVQLDLQANRVLGLQTGPAPTP